MYIKEQFHQWQMQKSGQNITTERQREARLSGLPFWRKPQKCKNEIALGIL